MVKMVAIGLAGLSIFFGLVPFSTPAEVNDLKPGQRIAVTGKYLPGGFFGGKRVVLKDAAEDALLQSEIGSISIDSKLLSLTGVDVFLDEKTEILDERAQRIPRRKLMVGNWVRIEGRRIGKRSLVAFRIEVIAARPDDQTVIEGEIQRLNDGDRFACLVLDIPILFDESVRFTDAREKRRSIHSIKRDDDDQQPAPLRIGDFLIIGGKVEVEVEPQNNLDLDGGEDEMASRLSFKPELSVNFNPEVQGYARFKLKRKPLIRSNDDDDASTRFEVSEMYLTYYDLFGAPLRMQFGRQKFKDKREWLFDETLDAFRLIYDTKRLDMQVGLIKGDFFPQDDRDDALNQLQYYLSTRVRLARRTYFTGFAYGRKHHDQNIALNWWGVQFRGQFHKIIRYWSNVASVFGTDEVNTVQGWGYDAGLRIGTRWAKPISLSVGMAYGSGDDNIEDREDSSFRQTGLQDNSVKLGGLKRVKYYGELFEPELSNMRILTIGLALRPTLQSSLELIFHAYHQVVAQPFLRDSNLGAEPLGSHRDLGKELDVVLTFREVRHLDVTLNLGYFRSGPAFGDTPANVFLGKIRMQVFY
ncbi:MAG: alginate export family protein [bacterium]